MKNLKRASVLGGIIFGLLVMSTVEARAQGNSGGVPALQTHVTTLIAQMEQAKLKIAQLEAALNREISARQVADAALQTAIGGSSSGVSPAALNAAIAAEAAARQAADTAEANARAMADTALGGQIANEVAARQALAGTVANLSDTVAPLASLTLLAPLATYLRVETTPINGLAGPHVIFEGANVHVRSGVPDSSVANGRGNLVVGYNEDSGSVPPERDGSHNVVIGGGHRYNFGTGFVVGYGSRLAATGASVAGGVFNNAEGAYSSVAGGRGNLAGGLFASVSGGESNLSSGDSASVTGGVGNRATGALSSVSGGSNNEASATSSTVGGGANRTNNTANSFVP